MHGRLSAEQVTHGALKRLGSRVVVFDEIDSTNSFLRRGASELPDGAAAFAEHQTAGRGRFGRTWVEPRGSSILMSVLLKERPGSPMLPLATTLACVAVCETVERATDVRPRIKPPNDVHVGSRKLAGVLAEVFSAEAALTAGRPREGETSDPAAGNDKLAVIGIGINCLQQRGHFCGELRETATSLEIESSQPVDRAAVARVLLERLDAWIDILCNRPDGRKRLVQAWQGRLAEASPARLDHDRQARSPGAPAGELRAARDRADSVTNL